MNKRSTVHMPDWNWLLCGAILAIGGITGLRNWTLSAEAEWWKHNGIQKPIGQIWVSAGLWFFITLALVGTLISLGFSLKAVKRILLPSEPLYQRLSQIVCVILAQLCAFCVVQLVTVLITVCEESLQRSPLTGAQYWDLIRFPLVLTGVLAPVYFCVAAMDADPRTYTHKLVTTSSEIWKCTLNCEFTFWQPQNQRDYNEDGKEVNEMLVRLPMWVDGILTRATEEIMPGYRELGISLGHTANLVQPEKFSERFAELLKRLDALQPKIQRDLIDSSRCHFGPRYLSVQVGRFSVAGVHLEFSEQINQLRARADKRTEEAAAAAAQPGMQLVDRVITAVAKQEMTPSEGSQAIAWMQEIPSRLNTEYGSRSTPVNTKNESKIESAKETTPGDYTVAIASGSTSEVTPGDFSLHLVKCVGRDRKADEQEIRQDVAAFLRAERYALDYLGVLLTSDQAADVLMNWILHNSAEPWVKDRTVVGFIAHTQIRIYRQ